MNAPRIQYARSSDGVNIAFWTLGEGPPLVHMPMGVSNCQLEWEMPECRRWYEALARHHRLVGFDTRGMGMSDRDVSAFAVEDLRRDLEAVVDRLGLRTLAVFASTNAVPVAIAFAARHSERVSRLIFWSGYATASEWIKTPAVQASRSLVDHEWVFFTETYAHRVMGWSEGEPANRYAALVRKSITREFLQHVYRETANWDAAPLLPKVNAPTLVLQRDGAIPGVQVARSLAARVPDAQLVILPGESAMPYLGDTESVHAAIADFLAEHEGEDKPKPALIPGGTAVILFADIAESTALTERLGDAAFRAKARDLDGALRTVIRENAGTPIEGKLLGDGVLAVFTSARQAIEAALACAGAGSDAGLSLHLGLHAGDVIREEGNVYGGAVNIASRISGLSAPGEVLVSETVRSLARTSAGVRFEDRGEQALKGVGEPVRVWAVVEA